MSVAAIMLVKDEADIIEPVVRHLLANVDEVIVADNGSTDGTREILHDLKTSYPSELIVGEDIEPAYYQSEKTTKLAMDALRLGHEWVIPCDADEIWYADGRPLKEFLAGLSPDVMIVEAEMHHHIPTAEDAPSWDVAGIAETEEGEAVAAGYNLLPKANPFERIGWRKRAAAALPKVAARLRPDLIIEAGNHNATVDGNALRSGGLHLRHFSWRSPEQYLRKIRNGEAAYAATSLPKDVGNHWRMWQGYPDEAILDHFERWFYSKNPRADETLIYDPVTPFLKGDA